jgi:hypothetical protein
MRTAFGKKIRIQMIEKDVTGAGIARSAGVDRTAIYKTIQGKIKSYRLRKAIAHALDIDVTNLWPKDARNK